MLNSFHFRSLSGAEVTTLLKRTFRLRSTSRFDLVRLRSLKPLKVPFRLSSTPLTKAAQGLFICYTKMNSPPILGGVVTAGERGGN